jgi:hypothetical protein
MSPAIELGALESLGNIRGFPSIDFKDALRSEYCSSGREKAVPLATFERLEGKAES